MKKAAFLSIKLALFLLAVFVVGQVWWYLWMYHGWVGTPRILHRFVFSDGEAAYDNTLFEMLAISGILVLAVYFLVRRPLAALTRRERNRG